MEKLAYPFVIHFISGKGFLLVEDAQERGELVDLVVVREGDDERRELARAGGRIGRRCWAVLEQVDDALEDGEHNGHVLSSAGT
jgi:hypothetical protein